MIPLIILSNLEQPMDRPTLHLLLVYSIPVVILIVAGILGKLLDPPDTRP